MRILVSLLVIVSLLLTISIEALSQPEKGLWQVGGSVAFNHDKEYNHLSINPAAGYFITNHLVAGTGLSFTFSKTAYSRIYGTGIYPYASYYFGKGKLQPLLSIAVPISYYSYKVEADYGGDNSSGWNTNFMTSAGVSYFLNDHAAIEGALAYNLDGKNFYLSFGFEIYLGKRKE